MSDELRARLQEASDKTLAKYDRLIAEPASVAKKWAGYGDYDSCCFCIVLSGGKPHKPTPEECGQCPISDGRHCGCLDIGMGDATCRDMRDALRDRVTLKYVFADIISAATARRAWLVGKLSAAGYCEVDR